MKLTKMRAAFLALGVAALATPALAQSSPSAPTGSETPRNQAPKGNVGTSSQQQTGGSGAMAQSDRDMKASSTKSRSHHASRHHRRHSMGTTGMGGSAHRPGNPNNGGPAEGIRNEAPKGDVSGNKMPSR
jgi:hypothetical protein